jgi:hypothetical protein
MAMNPSRLAYQDCYDLMEKAISSEFPSGLRVKFVSENEAVNFRHRLHNARQVDRVDNSKVFPDGHPMFGRSVYDVIICRIRRRGDGYWLGLERVDAREFTIEPLPKSEPEPVVLQNGGGAEMVVPMVKIQPKFPRRF